MSSDNQNGEDSLKDWVRKEMVSGKEEDRSMITTILNQHKEDLKQLVSIREDGKVTIKRYDTTARLQILTYMIGAAYARAAELREDDAVTNKELVDELHLKDGTVKPTLAALRKNDQITQKDEGLNRINYRKLPAIITQLKATKK